MSFSGKFLVLFVALFSIVSQAADQVPDCMAMGKKLEVNNEQVLNWKRSTQNQFRARGHVDGRVVRVYDDKTGHDHFSIQIGAKQDDTLEVIYNQAFGATPDVREGMVVRACGDYITASAQAGRYPPSPDGAIIHWIHRNPKDRGHDHGFLMLDGKLYGQEDPKDGKGRR